MRLRHLFSLFLLVSLIFTGCSSDDCDDDSPTSVNYSDFTGSTVDAMGDPLAGVFIVAMERSTNEKFVTHSSSDGSFSMEIEDGVYDIAFDLEGYKTRFLGPLTIPGYGEENYVLESIGNADNSLLAGYVYHRNDQSLAGWTVRAESKLADTLETEFAETTINESGYFELEIDGELLLDLDFISGTEVFEFVDIAKLDKPCEVTFTLGYTPNVLRHNESEGTEDSGTTSDQPTIGDIRKVWSKKGDSDLTSHHTNVPFSYYGFETPNILNYGKTYVNSGDTVIESDGLVAEGYTGTQSKVELHVKSKDDGSWWYTYAIHVKVYEHWEFASYQGNDYWRMGYKAPHSEYATDPYLKLGIGDYTGDSYSLKAYKSGWHKVSYNSKHPTITEIGWANKSIE